MDVKYNTDTKIEDNSRAFKLQKANFDKEVNTAVSIFLAIARLGSLLQNGLIWKHLFISAILPISIYGLL